MTEEKKNLSEEQSPSFLSGHEELLKSINPEPQEEATIPPVEETPVTPSNTDVTAEKEEEKESDKNEELSLFDNFPQVPENKPKEEETPAPEPEPAPVVEDNTDFLSSLPSLEPKKEAPEAPKKAPEPKKASETSKPKSKPQPKKAKGKKSKGKKNTKPKQELRTKAKPASAQPVKKAEPKKPEPAPAPIHERTPTEEERHRALLEKQRLEQQEVTEVLSFFKKYAKTGGIVLGVILVLFLSIAMVKANRQKKIVQADAALMQAKDPADLEVIVDQYASTPSAPIALMELARQKFNAGDIDAAQSLYTKFVQKYAQHELSTQAALNLIACKEAKGKLQQAEKEYGEFAQAHPNSYLVPAAIMAQARCLEEEGKLREAQTRYEDLIGNYPQTGWAQSASMKLDLLKAKQ